MAQPGATAVATPDDAEDADDAKYAAWGDDAAGGAGDDADADDDDDDDDLDALDKADAWGVASDDDDDDDNGDGDNDKAKPTADSHSPRDRSRSRSPRRRSPHHRSRSPRHHSRHSSDRRRSDSHHRHRSRSPRFDKNFGEIYFFVFSALADPDRPDIDRLRLAIADDWALKWRNFISKKFAKTLPSPSRPAVTSHHTLFPSMNFFYTHCVAIFLCWFMCCAQPLPFAHQHGQHHNQTSLGATIQTLFEAATLPTNKSFFFNLFQNAAQTPTIRI